MKNITIIRDEKIKRDINSPLDSLLPRDET